MASSRFMPFRHPPNSSRKPSDLVFHEVRNLLSRTSNPPPAHGAATRPGWGRTVPGWLPSGVELVDERVGRPRAVEVGPYPGARASQRVRGGQELGGAVTPQQIGGLEEHVVRAADVTRVH